MEETIYTFWEGEMPDYIKLCMNTWHFNYIVLNYQNLTNYVDEIPENLKKLSLPKISDYIRVHVLRDKGGYWLDADTILFSDKLPKENILGNPKTRTNSIGYLHTEPFTDMYLRWSFHQEYILKKLSDIKIDNTKWDIMGNSFTDTYIKTHKNIILGDISKCFPEINLKDNITRKLKYQKFYFEDNYTINDFQQTNMIMLHNSWTPDWYRKLNKDDVLKQKCTLSNILRELNEK